VTVSFDHACALVIGISNYRHIASLPAVQDAQDVTETLTRHGGYPPGNVRTLTDELATRAAIVAALQALAHRDPRPSLLLFYFSGHGGARRDAAGDDRDCYLMPFDGRWSDADDIADTALSGAELATLVERAGAERAVVILDCCRAGNVAVSRDVGFPLERELKSALGRLHRGRGRVVLAASSSDGHAFVRPGERNGVFTGHLLDGLRGACGGYDGVIDVADLYRYVQRKVAAEPEIQEPQFQSAVAGEMFAVARSPGHARRPHEHRARSNSGSVDRRELRRALHRRLRRIEEAEPMAPILGDVPAEEVTRTGWRRVPSLQRALIRNAEPVTVVEGGPGTGKSAFLRGLAVGLTAPDAPNRRSARSTALPLYVNLRDLEVPSGTPIDAGLIEAFVVDAWADQVPDLQATLRRGGPWLVLLDSFDEIPDLLSSSGSDALVARYAEAIEAFADRSAGCRVIVASRPYHGPKRTSWTRYRLLPLGEKRCRDIAASFFRSAGKGDDAVERFLGELHASRLPGWRDSPLVLNLICEHAAHRGGTLPGSLRDAFESLVARRIAARPDVLDRWGVTPGQLRLVAERAAFCMTADARIGLAVDVRRLLSALPAHGLEASHAVRDALDALVELRLARGSVVSGAVRDRFAFTHRRFQEYFAACCVRGGMPVAPAELLTDERWREIAITLLQAGEPAQVGSLLAHAADLLERAVAALPRGGRPAPELLRSFGDFKKAWRTHAVGAFCWPEHSAHVLGIVSSLAAAWGSVGAEHGESARRVRRAADVLLGNCMLGGVRADHAAAVELSGAATDPVRDRLLAWACAVRSEWLEDLAIPQAAAHGPLPLPVQHAVRRMLLRRALSGELRAERVRTEAQLRRVDHSGALVRTARWLLGAATADLLCWGVLASVFAVMVVLRPEKVELPIETGGPQPWHALLGPVIAAICGLGTPRLFRLNAVGLDRVFVRLPRLGSTASLAASAALTGILRACGAWFLLLPLALHVPWSDPWQLLLVSMAIGVFRPGLYAAAGQQHFGTGAWWRAALDVGWKLGATLTIVAAATAVTAATLDDRSHPLVTGTVAVVCSVLGGSLLVVVGFRLRDFLLDRRMRRRGSSIDAEQLLLDASRYRLAATRLRFLQRVREARLFRPGPLCERTLRDAILAIERDGKILAFRLHRGANPWVPDPRWSERFAMLYRAELVTRRGMAPWFGGPLDELSSLLTQTVFPDQVGAESSSARSAAKPEPVRAIEA